MRIKEHKRGVASLLLTFPLTAALTIALRDGSVTAALQR